MNKTECIVCDKQFEFKERFAPDFCAECQAVENVNGRRFANTSFDELVRYCVELEGDVAKLKLTVNDKQVEVE